MALFGKTKKSVKSKNPTSPRLRRARQAKLVAGVAHNIIRAPWFSEKALIATEKGVYTFVVPARATKAAIAGAIKEIYKVTPRMVRTANLPGKHKALRTRRGTGVRAARRKAYIYLNAGDTIQFS
jgi:ribosomal protein L23